MVPHSAPAVTPRTSEDCVPSLRVELSPLPLQYVISPVHFVVSAVNNTASPLLVAQCMWKNTFPNATKITHTPTHGSHDSLPTHVCTHTSQCASPTVWYVCTHEHNCLMINSYRSANCVKQNKCKTFGKLCFPHFALLLSTHHLLFTQSVSPRVSLFSSLSFS